MAHGVLIIEDETVLAKNIRLYLAQAGYDARAAESAEDGLRQLAEFKPDIVVLDYQLPGMNGLELLGELSRSAPGIKVVMLTGQGSVEMAVEAMKLGAADFLTKPVVLSKLKLVIEKVLNVERTEQALAYYRARDSSASGIAQLIGESAPMRQLKDVMRRLLEAEAALGDDEPPAVLITGETGAGKEVVARALHYDGPRRSGPFIELNCGAIPHHLLESELFGHESGTHSESRERKLGLIETADGGTLFLDEIGDMDIAVQTKLLKLLEEKSVRRLGGVRDQPISVRIIAATHQPLEKLVREGRFRSDLYFRLRIVELNIPPLRQRGQDILLLARHFLATQAARYGKEPPAFGADSEAALLAYVWPGNVRELRNVVEQTVLLSGEPIIRASQLKLCAVLGFDETEARPAAITAAAASAAPTAEGNGRFRLDEVERDLLVQALEKTDWNVSKSARLLGVSRDTLRYRMEKHGLVRSE
ncbi:MAG: sigma-54-dependent Fis family transcriptional regulator [Betaproteobacteria bacterium HGW-Betaproteobacteria-12]|nr:MAG: sigma-54-dependent Fis family transcriptional regulator [Betaproteobacteria bacterium HGW-Betaproteobacteria-12]